MTIEELKGMMEKFTENNSKSQIEHVTLGGDEKVAVVNPWSDPSLVLAIPDEGVEEFAEILNSVILPERLSAILHVESSALEIAWTAYRLTKNNREASGRKFEFAYMGTTYICGFRETSKALLEIASASKPVGPSETSYRNLPSYAMYMDAKERAEGEEGNIFQDSPESFWIENVNLPEDELVSFLNHLNFYMSYYDEMSPLIIIHPPTIQRSAESTAIRYRHGRFPKKISSKAIEPEVFSFWNACQTRSASSRFLYSFRIIEYSAFYYVESSHRTAVRKALMAPHALDDVAGTTDQIIAALRTARMEDMHRFERVVLQSVEPQLLWEVIAAYIDVFSSPASFEGGFELGALIASINSKEEFSNSGLKSFCTSVRQIRNALSHGKEERSSAVIAPTRGNEELLRPWAAAMMRVAGEVILYRNSQ